MRSASLRTTVSTPTSIGSVVACGRARDPHAVVSEDPWWWPHLDAGKGRVDASEAVVGGDPGAVCFDDLGAGPGDEVPPHENLFVEGHPAEQQDPGRLSGCQ